MFLQAQPGQFCVGIDAAHLGHGQAREQRMDHRHQPAHDQRIAVADEIEAAILDLESAGPGVLAAKVASVFRAAHTIKGDAGAVGAAPLAEPSPEPVRPAVPIKKSVANDYIVCLEDGKKFKSLKRHLSSQYNMTPEQYREKWGLPADYPMVAPAYAEARSNLAKKMGLGQQRRRRS